MDREYERMPKKEVRYCPIGVHVCSFYHVWSHDINNYTDYKRRSVVTEL